MHSDSSGASVQAPGLTWNGTCAGRIEVFQWKVRAFEHLFLAFLA